MDERTRALVDDVGWDSDWAALEGRMVQLYTRSAPRTIHQFWQRCYFEDLWSCLGPNREDAKYLELGAGRGTTSMYLASKGCDVTMLDLSGNGFKVAQANFAREGLRAPSFVKADARQTNLPAASFDCVFSIGLLEHFPDPKPVLTETMRLLRPGGFHFALIVPDRPPSVRYLSHALLQPWLLVYELMPQKVRAGLRKLRNRPASAGKEVLRTVYGRCEYLKMLEDMDVTDARCIPYNPYHPVYRHALLESWIVIPLYRLHRTIKKLFTRRPAMATAAGLASCELLTFRKRG